MKRLLLIAVCFAACASTQKVKDEARIDEESDSVSAKREQGGDAARKPAQGNSGVFSGNLAEQMARQAQLLKEAEAACEAEVPETLSDGQLAELAKAREDTFVKATGPRVENAAALKELTRIGRAVSKETPDLRFGLTSSELPRVFFASTGAVLVTTGLVKKCANEAQLAAVLAHEAAHVRARAEEKPYATMLRTRCVSARAMKDVMPQFTEPTLASLASMMAGIEAMGRDEDSADRAALTAVSAAGYDPAEYEAFVRALGDTSQDGVTSEGGAERRVARLQAARAGLKSGKKPALPKALLAL